MSTKLVRLVVAVLGAACLPCSAGAATIIPTYADGAGQTWDSVRKGVVQEAINEWQANILDDQTIHVAFDFTNAGAGSYLGQWDGSFSAPSGTNIYPWTPGVTQKIHFNADYFSGSNYLWWDPTPGTANDLPFEAWDALSVARHELGHLLGFADQFYYDQLGTAQQKDKWSNLITGVTFDPGELNVSMTSDLSHLVDSGVTTGDLMVPLLVNGSRRDISVTDLNMLHRAYGYQLVPEPSTLVLLTVGVLGLAFHSKRRRQTPAA